MQISRRDFLKASAVAGAMAGSGLILRPINAHAAFPVSPALTKFITPLPGLGPTGIPVATPNKTLFPGSDFYHIAMRQFTQQLHPELPGPTTLYGYVDITDPNVPANPKHLGGLIVAQRNTPVRVMFTNELPATHILPVDPTVMDASTGAMQDRAAVHLHGAHVHWISDGGPFAWFSPSTYGPDSIGVPDMTAPVGSQTYYYPNDQSARLMWYHDHAWGITRLNAYAGLATGYVIQDPVEQGLVTTGMLPPAARTIPLIIQDKIFVPAGGIPGYTWGNPGDMWYPTAYDLAYWITGPPTINAPNPALPFPTPVSAVPEFAGDTMLVNGVAYPTVTLEPRRYRFRILNACNTRFVNLKLFYAQTAAPTEPNLRKVGPSMVQIATEGGFLPAPVTISNRGAAAGLLLGCAERADVIIDFTRVPVGSVLILNNDAPSPFPVGNPAFDVFPGNPLTPFSVAGKGPNTRTLMQIKIGPLVGPADPKPPALKLPPMDPPALAVPGVTTLPPGVKVRDLTLNEDFDDYGRLVTHLGTNVKLYPTTFGRQFLDDPTEVILEGSVEIWRIFNLTADTHPMHFHLANCQIISRQAFNAATYTGAAVTFLGAAVPPALNERGWKETVRMNPGECTTVIMKFDLPAVPASWDQFGGLPLSQRTTACGHEYVWHCHILEHEEHDMMRPIVIK